MPLLINAVSKITNKGVIIKSPSKDVLYKYLNTGNKVLLKSKVVLPYKHYADNKLIGMTTEQKRKLMLLRYIRQYT